MNEQERFLITQLFNTEYGQAFKQWAMKELADLESQEEHGAKICNDPLHEDFRVKLGRKIQLRQILRLPEDMKPK